MLRFLIYGNCNDFLNILQDILLGKVKNIGYCIGNACKTPPNLLLCSNKQRKIVIQMFRKNIEKPSKLKENSENIIRHS